MNIIRLACISDTHTQHRQINIPTCDILIIAGDLTYRGESHVIRDMDEWFGELKKLGKVREVVVIVGNHDLTFDPKKPEYKQGMHKLFTNCIYLENRSAEVMGINFYGSPASVFFHNWGFNYHRGDEISTIWNLMLQDHTKKAIDVIITHGPCNRILDWVEYEDWTFDPIAGGSLKKQKEYVGDKDLLKVVKQIQPALFCSGHIHCAYGSKEKNGTLFVNASTCTEEYKPSNPPIEVQLERVGDKWKAKIVKQPLF